MNPIRYNSGLFISDENMDIIQKMIPDVTIRVIKIINNIYI